MCIGKRTETEEGPSGSSDPGCEQEDAGMKPRKKLKDVLKEKLEKAPRVLIDCDFAQVQKDREIKSMVVQISECIASNKKAESPFNIRLTGVHKDLKDKLSKQYS